MRRVGLDVRGWRLRLAVVMSVPVKHAEEIVVLVYLGTKVCVLRRRRALAEHCLIRRTHVGGYMWGDAFGATRSRASAVRRTREADK